MKAKTLIRGAGCLALLAGSSTAALAQTSPGVLSVTEREREQARNEGIRADSWILRPQIEAALVYDDNVYARPTAVEDDMFLRTRATLGVQSDFRVHDVNAQAYVSRETFFDLSSEDATEYGGRLGGTYEFTPEMRFTASGGYDRLAESRSSLLATNQTPERVTYDTAYVDGALSGEFGPMGASVTGRWRTYAFDPVTLGGVLADFRDFTATEGNLDLSYGIHRITRLVLHGSVERRLYELRSGSPGFDPAVMLDRSSKGYRIEAGVQRQLTELIQGTIRVGYMNYEYDDPSLAPIQALSYHADVVWNVTPLSTVILAVDRRLDETLSPEFAGNLRDEFRIGARHELRRNLILFGNIRYAHIKLVDTPIDSQEIEAEVGARYYIGRHVRVNLLANHARRTSDSPTLEFDRNRIMIGVTFSR